MFKSIALIALGTLALVAAQDLTISTPPSLVQCQPVLISWSGGASPYILDVIPGGQTGAAALENLQNGATGTSYSWTVNLASGTSVTLKITDKNGQIQYSSPLTIQAGSSDSCLNTSVSGGGGSASGSASATSGSASGSASSGAASTSSAAASSSAAATTSRAASTTSAPASSSSGNAASSVSSAAATTSGAAYKKYEVPAAILAAVGGVAALL